MKLMWQIEGDDVRKVKEFFDENKDNGLVVWRRERNVEKGYSRFSRHEFWKEMTVCLVTTQARAGPGSPVLRFANQKPFPLRYSECSQRWNLKSFTRKIVADFGGIRRNVTISEQVHDNFRWLEKQGGWEEIKRVIRETS